jgi:hypothetical protein
MIEDEEDSVFRLRNALIRPNAETDRYFLTELKGFFNFNVTNFKKTTKDSIYVNKELVLNNVQFVNVTDNISDGAAFLNHISFQKDVRLSNVTNILIASCSFKAHVEIRFFITISNGGYESLKSKGIEILKNDTLRNKIVYFYENKAPRYLSFVHENDDILEQNIDRLTTKIFNLEPAKGEDGKIVLGYVPIHKDLLNDQNLYQVVKIFYQDLSSKRYRIRSLKRDYLKLNEVIETYLREKNISFTPFDRANVIINF